MKKLIVETDDQLAVDIISKDSSGSDRPADGKLLARSFLTDADLQLPYHETWLSGMRAGKLTPHLHQYQPRVIPGKDTGAGKLDGYFIELCGEGSAYRRHFTVRSLAGVVRQRTSKLLEASPNEPIEDYFYYLTTVPGQEVSETQPGTIVGQPCDEPLRIEQASLATYLASSQTLVGVGEPPAVDPHKQDPIPIFVSPAVWAESRDLAFRGGENESAALFSGRLLRDTESPELFVQLDACLETLGAIEDRLSVTFTEQAWAGALRLLSLRRERLNRPNEMIVASVHRHPFAPAADANGRRMCDACSTAKYCGRTTAVPSTDDFQWHRSVFAAAPWSTLVIWGYNAREESDFRIYGVENGAFQERTIRLLDRDF